MALLLPEHSHSRWLTRVASLFATRVDVSKPCMQWLTRDKVLTLILTNLVSSLCVVAVGWVFRVNVSVSCYDLIHKWGTWCDCMISTEWWNPFRIVSILSSGSEACCNIMSSVESRLWSEEAWSLPPNVPRNMSQFMQPTHRHRLCGPANLTESPYNLNYKRR